LLVREKKIPLLSSSIKFPKVWPGYILAISAFLFAMIESMVNPQNKFSVSAFLITIIAIVYWNVCVYKIHKTVFIMADNCYPISPARAVGFGFLPFYNIYWMFKWPAETIHFIKHRSNTKVWGPAIPGLLFLLSGSISAILGALGIIIEFAVLTYLVKKLKEDLAIKPEAVPYKSKPTSMSPVIVIAIAIIPAMAIVGLLAAIAIPNLVRAREIAIVNACTANLNLIQAAKELWAIDTNVTGDATPKWEDLIPLYIKEKPSCPKGGDYTIGSMNSVARCSIEDNNTSWTTDDHILK